MKKTRSAEDHMIVILCMFLIVMVLLTTWFLLTALDAQGKNLSLTNARFVYCVPETGGYTRLL